MNINLQIGNQSLHFEGIPANLEQPYRRAARHLSDRYTFYLQKMPQAKAEQIWLYVALESTVNLQSDIRDKAIEPIEQAIKHINKSILTELNQGLCTLPAS